ncbi:MAG: uroporphyrinogen-III synthase [Myxococcota bacterium]|nr:uroporphyrinogen-III synthase [Myxococcota bacterium]
MTDRGIVCFVGLGPGDPSLLTARAVERIAQADVVVHDEDGEPASRLVALAREGKRVVRAVPGDALESPRTLDEVREIARAGVAVEVIPGIGAGGIASAFVGLIGPAVRVDARHLKSFVDGAPREAVVTLVVNAGGPSQRVIQTTAADALDRAGELGDVTVIVAFGAPDPQLRWFERRPLFGKRVLVTRAQDQASVTATLLRDCGAEPLVVPTITIHPPSDRAPLARALSSLRSGAYAWVAFTSANGVERVWESVEAEGGDARTFGASRLAAIGPATARALERHGLRADVVAKEFRGEGLADEILHALAGAKAKVLLARAARARDALPEALRAAGCVVDVVAAYETHPPPRETIEALVDELDAGRVDAVMFTSSSTVQNLCDLLGGKAPELLERVRIASIGPLTTDAALSRGLRVDVTAATYTVPDLVRALADSWRG